MRIVITGGGTGGHVIPNLAVIEEIKKFFPDVLLLYLGSGLDIEKKLIPKDVAYRRILCGKLRRYFSFFNLIDLLKLPIGIIQSFFILARFKPKVIFAKGGYVSIPPVIAGKFLKIPVIIHESDITPGLANRILAHYASKIAVAFPITKRYLKKKLRTKVVVCGNPIRKEIFNGDRRKASRFFRLNSEQPVILVTGGSTGARNLNLKLLEILPNLVSNYQIIHQYGQSPIKFNHPNYHGFNFLQKEIADAYAAADIVIARAGANTIFEIAALGKPAILVPLSLKASRGDQIKNANFIKENADIVVIPDNELTGIVLERKIRDLLTDGERLESVSRDLKKIFPTDCAKKIVSLIFECSK